MKKRNSLIITITVAALTFITSAFPALAVSPKNVTHTTVISQSAKDQAEGYMLKMGLDPNFVKNAPDSELLNFVNAKPVSETEKYYRVSFEPIPNSNKVKSTYVEISKDQCDKEVAAYKTAKKSAAVSPATVQNGYNLNNSTSWLELQIWANETSTNKFHLSTAATWKVSPYYRQEDVIGIGHDTWTTSLQNTDYFYSQYYFNWSNQSKWITSTRSTADSWSVNGSGFVWSLPDDDNLGIGAYDTSLYCYMSYDVQVATSGWTGLMAASANYAHQQSSYEISPSFSFPAGGSLSLSSSNSYDIVPVGTNFHN